MDVVRAAMKTARVPGPRDPVYKDECMFSFDNPESPAGLYTSLTTWKSYGRDFVMADFREHGHPLYLKQVFRRVTKEEATQSSDAENGGDTPAPLPTKLAIGVEGGFNVDTPKHDTIKLYFVVALPDLEKEIPAVDNPELPELVSATVSAIIAHEGVAKAAQIAAAWEEEDRKVSRYAEDLPFVSSGKRISPNPAEWKCEESGMKENLWLNLSTGYIGSGRRNFDGSGGTGAALKHYEETGRKYPLAVKLGTITPHGADVYSYAADEDDMVIDPHLAEHLARWGINMQLQEKTEKTMAELQIEANATFEWDKLTESGADLVKLAGPGYVGLQNLGNSCYMNSILQILFTLPVLKKRYVDMSETIIASTPAEPTEDLITMLSKVGVGLLTDRYAFGTKVYATAEEARASTQEGSHGDNLDVEKVPYEPSSVRPFAFKTLVGKGHPEFSTSRQQDAGAFFQHLLDCISRAERTGSARVSGDDAEFIPTASLFQMELEDRVQCDQSGKVRYKTRPENILVLPIPVEAATNKQLVDEYEERKQKKQKMESSSAEDDPVKLHIPFEACLDEYSASEVITDFLSSATGAKGTAQKRTRIRSFPEFLVIQMSKYYVADDWTPKKLDVCVPLPEVLDLEHVRGTGVSSGEELLPDDPPSTSSSSRTEATVQPDADIVAQVVAMGFSENGAKRAAVATGNTSAEASMNWVLSHMEDPDFNDPLVVDSSENASDAAAAEPSKADLSQLTVMGFTTEQAAVALKATDGNLERAADWLFSHADDLDSAVAAEKSRGESTGQAASIPTFVDGPGVYELVGFASHMGSNTSCGHYVAHVKKEGRFVLYNDEKVAISQSPPLGYGFIYLYKRKSAS